MSTDLHGIADSARLQMTLEEFLRGSTGEQVRITSLQSEPSPFASRVPAHVVRVALDTGQELTLFFKNPGSEEADHPDKQRRDREIRVYERLFAGQSLPVPRFYGARSNSETRRREVFLEFVDDWDLRYQNLACWYLAAARLADLHAHFARRRAELDRCDFLLRFDRDHFQAWAERALESVSQESAPLGSRVERVVRQYGRVTDLLDAQPRTLVHNDLAGKNILADRSVEPPRVCIVDWEMAGVGPGLLDLVHVSYGLDSESEGLMHRAYFGRLEGSELVPADSRELAAVLAACRIHEAMVRLWRNRLWRLPAERVEEWVVELEDALARI